MLCLFTLLTTAAAAEPADPWLAAPDEAEAAGARGAEALERAAHRGCRLARPEAPCEVTELERRPLAGDVAHYRLALRVGEGEHQVLGLHRVVRESAPYEPVRAPRGLFLVHGDVWGFAPAFLPAGESLPVFLARAGVDVWGVDLTWTRLPPGVTDFAFLADHGMAADARDLEVALSAARQVRRTSGSGGGRLHLLGWSRGAQTGYAYLSAESQRPPGRRHVAGYVPVDVYFKTDDETLRQNACIRHAAQEERLDAGDYADPTGLLVAALGALALADPEGDSQILVGLTHRQAALVTGAATFLFFPPGLEPVPLYHFTGGSFDENGLPDGLLYTPEARLFELLAAGAPYEPVRLLADAEAAICDEIDVDFDDHLGEVAVPVLYVGAAGGFGATGLDTLARLGSADVTHLVVELLPAEARLLDYGHADLFLAPSARDLVWQPLLDWLETR